MDWTTSVYSVLVEVLLFRHFYGQYWNRITFAFINFKDALAMRYLLRFYYFIIENVIKPYQ